MTASPQQRMAANALRGYNPEYVAQVCACGCTRAVHANTTEKCNACRCKVFRLAAVQTYPQSKRNYCFGTLPAPPPPS